MTTQQTKVDWSRPIETNDGKPASHCGEEDNGCYLVRWHDSEGRDRGHYFLRDGRSNVVPDRLWVRNVAQPEAPTPSPELTARMVEFVREVARRDDSLGDDACALLAELKPVDGDLIEAREVYIAQYDLDEDGIAFVRSGGMDSGQDMQAIFAAIRRGRALAEAGK